MPDDALRLTSQFDIGPISSGMKEASSVVEAETEAMNEAFRTTVTSSEEAFKEVSYASVEAKHAIHGLGEELGVHVPRFVQTFIAELGGVGPLMAAAFTPVAVIGLGEVLVDVGKKVYEFYEDVVNLKNVFDAIDESEKKLTVDMFAMSNALVTGHVRLTELTAGPLAGAKEKISALGEEIVDLGKMVDINGKKFSDAFAVKASLREFLVPTQAKDFEDSLKRVGAEIRRVQGLLLNTEEGTTKYEELSATVQLLSSFYDALALKVQKFNQDLAISGAELQKVKNEQADKKQDDVDYGAKLAKNDLAAWQKSFHDRTIADLNEAERASKEKQHLLGEEAKDNAEFDKSVLAEIKRVDAEIERSKKLGLAEAVAAQNKEIREAEKALKRTEQVYKQAYAKIAGDVNSNVIEMINGQEGFGRAVQKIWTGIVDSVVQAVLKIGENWLEGVLLHKAMSLIIKQTNAGVAAGGALASQAPIPIVGPELGQVAAAEAYAEVMAFAKGGIVPKDTPALLHANEMVLPAHISQAVQASAAGGVGGGHTFNYSYNGSGSRAEGQRSHKDFMKLAMRELRRRGMATA